MTTDGATSAADGNRLGGYFVIDVADRESAQTCAGKAPVAGGGRVEVRGAYPAPTMR